MAFEAYFSVAQRSPTTKWRARLSRMRAVMFPVVEWTPAPSTWSELPVELVSEILIYTALASRQDAFNLCLVSSSVRRLILPCLYHNVLLRTAEQVPLFAAPFTPKRSPFALLGAPPSTKLVAHVPVHSLALAVPPKRPSIEQTLERIANALTSIENLAISAQLLGAHAYWLRKHTIRPHTVMLYHLGRPHPVNFREPCLANVTHLHTSTLTGFHGSSICDLPQLTHVALCTRIRQTDYTIQEVKRGVTVLLASCKNLSMVVLSLDVPPPREPSPEAERWYGQLKTWYSTMRTLHDPRLYILPFARRPRLEWRYVTESGPDVFELARRWREAEDTPNLSVRRRKLDEMRAEVWAAEYAFPTWKTDREWDVDLTQSPEYQYGRNSGLDISDTDTIMTW
ncbi:hypothetical protein FA95DRAFT_1558557 [Auriscalpium vulgare]|uniref:Uncharacterized protein n=1 Tax=Auriscalpium vulgare TaxID=40419 RepID=A0ACB8RVH6_9AGAM|nr:hypothetical protein FA95DRAFT_1558557 [Auriscalpium vulgare]